MSDKKIVMEGVTEYSEESEVEITRTGGTYDDEKGKGRLVIRAWNEAG